MKKLQILFCLFWAVLVFEVPAQPFFINHRFSSSDGLKSHVQDIAQDESGIMWFGTWSGLVKYDGYEFTSYTNENSIGSKRFVKITPVKEGFIWCLAYDNQLYRFDTNDNSFLNVSIYLNEMVMRQLNVLKTFYLKNGAIWICCNDGYNFRIEGSVIDVDSIQYFAPNNKKLPGRNVVSVDVDSEGDEWVITDACVKIFGKKNQVINHPFDRLTQNGIYVWLIDRAGNVGRYNLEKQEFQLQLNNKNFSYIGNFVPLSDNRLAVGTNDGLYFFDFDKAVYSKQNVPTKGNVSLLNIDSQNNLWFGDEERGIGRYDIDNQSFYRLFTKDEDLPEMNRNPRCYYLELPDGIILAKPKDGVLGYLANNKLIPITDNNITAQRIFVDRQNNLWYVNTLSNGVLSTFNRQTTYFKTDSEVRCVFKEDEDRLWIADKFGVVRIVNSVGENIGYLSAKGNIVKEETAFGHNIYAMCKHNDGSLWLGTRNEGLCIIHPTGKVVWYRNNPQDRNSLNNNAIFHIYADSKNRIWIGTWGGGLNMVDLDNGYENLIFYHQQNFLVGYPQDTYNNIRYIREVDNVMLVCADKGLLTLSSEKQRPENIRFFTNSNNLASSSLHDINIMSAFQDSQKNIYIMPYAGQISRIVSENLLTDSLNFEQVLYGHEKMELSMSAIEDKNGNLWFVTENTLTQYNSVDGSVSVFDCSYFGRNFKFMESQVVLMDNGDMWLGTDNGFLRLNVNTLKKNEFSPNIVVTEVSSGDNIFKSSRYNGKMELEKNERSFTIQFAALDYTNTRQIEYAYRLLPDENWHYINKDHRINFVNLPHGHYTLEVKSTNGDLLWCDNVMQLAIHVKPIFTETGWFYAMMFLLLIVITAAVYLIRVYIYRLIRNVEKKFKKNLYTVDNEFVEKVEIYIKNNITNPELNVDEIAAYMNMSRSAFYLKMKATANVSPVEFIMRVRMNHARGLFNTGKYNVSEVAIESGFSDSKYFSKCFKRYYGVSPSEYKRK